MFGDTLVVGARLEDSGATGVNRNQNDNSAFDSGAAYVFVRTGTSWSQQAYLKASNTEELDYFGTSVAVSGDTVVIGATGESSAAIGVNGDQSDNSAFFAGAAYVFVRSGTNWSQQAYLKGSNTGEYNFFGAAVAASDSTVVVGADEEDSTAIGVNGTGSSPHLNFNSGAAYVFVRSGTNWSQQAYLKASNTDTNDLFGTAVAVSGDTVVVGAVGESSALNVASFAGAAYVFVRSGTTWSQQAYLKASNSEANDYFGISVGVSGNTVVVGAYNEDSNATGVNNNQTNNSATESGAAYGFVRYGTTWIQHEYLKASNSGMNDFFGRSVAVSRGTVVIGASGESSSAIGVNQNQNDNDATQSGAAYVFTGLGVARPLTIVPDGSGGYFVFMNGFPLSTYALQRASNIAGPWSTVRRVSAPASGFVEFHDTIPPIGQSFYRIESP